MRKYTLPGGVILLCLLFLAGCRTMVPGERFDTDAISKAQRIVVSDTAGNEKAVLTEEEDINAFVDAINAGGWRFQELPEDLTEAGSFTLWQTETVTALVGEGEVREIELCAFRVYEDGDYLTIETMLGGVTFSISPETAAYLRSLLA